VFPCPCCSAMLMIAGDPPVTECLHCNFRPTALFLSFPCPPEWGALSLPRSLANGEMHLARTSPLEWQKEARLPQAGQRHNVPPNCVSLLGGAAFPAKALQTPQRKGVTNLARMQFDTRLSVWNHFGMWSTSKVWSSSRTKKYHVTAVTLQKCSYV
jgi:hypothetical protein